MLILPRKIPTCISPLPSCVVEAGVSSSVRSGLSPREGERVGKKQAFRKSPVASNSKPQVGSCDEAMEPERASGPRLPQQQEHLLVPFPELHPGHPDMQRNRLSGMGGGETRAPSVSVSHHQGSNLRMRRGRVAWSKRERHRCTCTCEKWFYSRCVFYKDEALRDNKWHMLWSRRGKARTEQG